MHKEKFSFGLAVLKLMRRNKMTQKKLSELIGNTRRSVADTIKRDQPTIGTCERYADALGVTLIEFIQEGYIR